VIESFYFIGVVKHAHEIESLPKNIPFILLAPTFVMTFNICTTTMNFALHILVREMTNLQRSHLIRLQEMRHVKYVVIVEMNLIKKC
jgi:hypothetical protein